MSKENPRRNIHAELIAHLLHPGEVWIVNAQRISAQVMIDLYERDGEFHKVRSLDEAYDVWGQIVSDSVSIVGYPVKNNQSS